MGEWTVSSLNVKLYFCLHITSVKFLMMHSKSFPEQTELAVASQTRLWRAEENQRQQSFTVAAWFNWCRITTYAIIKSFRKTHPHTQTDKLCDVHPCSASGSNEQVGRGASLSCTDVPFITRRRDITGPAGSRALEPRLLHTRLQKAVLLGEAHKPATGVSAWEFNYAGALPPAYVCVSLWPAAALHLCPQEQKPGALRSHTPNILKLDVFMLFNGLLRDGGIPLGSSASAMMLLMG